MKQLLLVLITTLFSATNLPAQDVNKNNNTQFGIKLGMNYARIHFTNTAENELPKVSWLAGAVAGVFLKVPVTGKLSFQPEYLMSMQGYKLEKDSVFRLNYFSLPVLLKLEVADRLSIVGGGSFDLLLWAKEKGRSNHEAIKGLETRNIGITGGLEYSVTDAIDLMIRYMQSLNHIDDIYREREFKNMNMQLTVGYRF